MSEEEIEYMIRNAVHDHLTNIHKQDKRFEAAKAAMQGYIASNSMELYHNNHDACMKDICESSVKYADALLAELERAK
ncbi:MAG: hypothetical protein EOM68_28645 [Spirochaetia bacterium]|nr:hypothetical protein [Spirochaetia bacterium]